MLRDAQHLQVRGERVEMWVKDLEGIAHEVMMCWMNMNMNFSGGKWRSKTRSRKRSTLVNATSHDIGGLDRETVSNFDQDEKYIVGRTEVASDIVTTLINSGKNQESCLSVMAIVGMGGLGKTTWLSPYMILRLILSEILECLKPEKAGIKGKATICENCKKI
ncbi:unnamed protein product [Prunus armeniaca]|uniref:NB-ARC domain-containing protein n=1 Tax=Prunus armeniaca TaxID=36596 RepID=A0A6J5WDD0_PRUAR|nr:unnamed protein product [Prunus armeniaca]